MEQEKTFRIEIGGLHDRLIEVRRNVRYLKKENQSHQYAYVSSEQVLTEIRDLMNQKGLLAYPSIRSHQLHTHESISKDGKPRTWFMFDAVIDYTIVCPGTGESLVIPWAGQGVDDGEKGLGKALTYAEKYLFLKLFLIPTGKDDPDAHQNQDGERGTKAAAAPAARAAAPVPPVGAAPPVSAPAQTAPAKSGGGSGGGDGGGWREFAPADVRVETRKGRSLYKLKGVTEKGSVDFITWDTKVGDLLSDVAEKRGRVKAHISKRTNGKFTDYHVDEAEEVA